MSVLREHDIIVAYCIFKIRAVKQEFIDYLFPDDIYAGYRFLKSIFFLCCITVFSATLSPIIPLTIVPQYLPEDTVMFITYSLLNLIIFDFIMFSVHMLQHRISFLWKFHKFHHEPEKLDFLVAFRHHPVDIVLITAALALAHMLLARFIPVGFENNIFILGFYFCGYHLRHPISSWNIQNG